MYSDKGWLFLDQFWWQLLNLISQGSQTRRELLLWKKVWILFMQYNPNPINKINFPSIVTLERPANSLGMWLPFFLCWGCFMESTNGSSIYFYFWYSLFLGREEFQEESLPVPISLAGAVFICCSSSGPPMHQARTAKATTCCHPVLPKAGGELSLMLQGTRESRKKSTYCQKCHSYCYL